MSEKAQPNGFSWEYHGGKRIALSNGPVDALVATGDHESAWLDISDENAQIVQDAFNCRATPTPDVAGLVEEARRGLRADDWRDIEKRAQDLLLRLADCLESLSRERTTLAEGFKAAVRELNHVVDPFVLGALRDHEPDIHTGGRWTETPQRIIAMRKALALIGEGKERG